MSLFCFVEPCENSFMRPESIKSMHFTERKLSVAISNPPKRKEELQQLSFNATSSSHQRSKIDLVPRTLARNIKLAKSSSDNNSNDSGSTFRDSKTCNISP
uniref:C2H2-type domain-containing protein n=1 Tax=Elaeophora elaphi TaxID=1147741 RepID=A0A0R3S595_9BILA